MGFLRKIVERAKIKKQMREKAKAQKDVFGNSKKSVFDQMSSKPKGAKWDF